MNTPGVFPYSGDSASVTRFLSDSRIPGFCRDVLGRWVFGTFVGTEFADGIYQIGSFIIEIVNATVFGCVSVGLSVAILRDSFSTILLVALLLRLAAFTAFLSFTCRGIRAVWRFLFGFDVFGDGRTVIARCPRTGRAMFKNPRTGRLTASRRITRSWYEYVSSMEGVIYWYHYPSQHFVFDRRDLPPAVRAKAVPDDGRVPRVPEDAVYALVAPSLPWVDCCVHCVYADSARFFSLCHCALILPHFAFGPFAFRPTSLPMAHWATQVQMMAVWILLMLGEQVTSSVLRRLFLRLFGKSMWSELDRTTTLMELSEGDVAVPDAGSLSSPAPGAASWTPKSIVGIPPVHVDDGIVRPPKLGSPRGGSSPTDLSVQAGAEDGASPAAAPGSASAPPMAMTGGVGFRMMRFLEEGAAAAESLPAAGRSGPVRAPSRSGGADSASPGEHEEVKRSGPSPGTSDALAKRGPPDADARGAVGLWGRVMQQTGWRGSAVPGDGRADASPSGGEGSRAPHETGPRGVLTGPSPDSDPSQAGRDTGDGMSATPVDPNAMVPRPPELPVPTGHAGAAAAGKTSGGGSATQAKKESKPKKSKKKLAEASGHVGPFSRGGATGLEEALARQLPPPLAAALVHPMAAVLQAGSRSSRALGGELYPPVNVAGPGRSGGHGPSSRSKSGSADRWSNPIDAATISGLPGGLKKTKKKKKKKTLGETKASAGSEAPRRRRKRAESGHKADAAELATKAPAPERRFRGVDGSEAWAWQGVREWAVDTAGPATSTSVPAVRTQDAAGGTAGRMPHVILPPDVLEGASPPRGSRALTTFITSALRTCDDTHAAHGDLSTSREAGFREGDLQPWQCMIRRLLELPEDVRPRTAEDLARMVGVPLPSKDSSSASRGGRRPSEGAGDSLGRRLPLPADSSSTLHTATTSAAQRMSLPSMPLRQRDMHALISSLGMGPSGTRTLPFASIGSSGPSGGDRRGRGSKANVHVVALQVGPNGVSRAGEIGSPHDAAWLAESAVGWPGARDDVLRQRRANRHKRHKAGSGASEILSVETDHGAPAHSAGTSVGDGGAAAAAATAAPGVDVSVAEGNSVGALCAGDGVSAVAGAPAVGCMPNPSAVPVGSRGINAANDGFSPVALDSVDADDDGWVDAEDDEEDWEEEQEEDGELSSEEGDDHDGQRPSSPAASDGGHGSHPGHEGPYDRPWRPRPPTAPKPGPKGSGGAGPGAVARGRDCAVCIDAFRAGDLVRRLPCGHTFHASCIDFAYAQGPWRDSASFCPAHMMPCPYCRTPSSGVVTTPSELLDPAHPGCRFCNVGEVICDDEDCDDDLAWLARATAVAEAKEPSPAEEVDYADLSEHDTDPLSHHAVSEVGSDTDTPGADEVPHGGGSSDKAQAIEEPGPAAMSASGQPDKKKRTKPKSGGAAAAASTDNDWETADDED
eukprot:TRINITY_DN2124_c1_g1_i1.p1 TRINITY_DN2124_c1_g1~~TRINITY_DN2124_c1_g1_i1.p1  ORF type:complete len:1437 (-),score=148.93 TRINITY_DN2124_c1_g1_i1:1029-5339(-)